MSHKITTLNLSVPYKKAGNVIYQNQVSFDVFQTDDHYKLVPCLNEQERQIANLPPELQFTVENGKPVSLRGKRDGNFHVIQDAVSQLQQLNVTI